MIGLQCMLMEWDVILLMLRKNNILKPIFLCLLFQKMMVNRKKYYQYYI